MKPASKQSSFFASPAPVYYNTNREEGEVLAASIDKAQRQQARVLAFFQAHPERNFTRDYINLMVLPGAPYTSVQRCLSNLTQEGKLRKTRHMVIGPWGKKVHTWVLTPPHPWAKEHEEH